MRLKESFAMRISDGIIKPGTTLHSDEHAWKMKLMQVLYATIIAADILVLTVSKMIDDVHLYFGDPYPNDHAMNFVLAAISKYRDILTVTAIPPPPLQFPLHAL